MATGANTASSDECRRGGKHHGIQSVHQAAVARQQVAHVLDPEVTLQHRFGQVPEDRGRRHRHPDDRALPVRLMQEIVDQEGAADAGGDKRAGKALPGFLRADRRCHRMLAEEHARRISARIGQHDHRQDGQHAKIAVVRTSQENAEEQQERDVRRDQGGRRDVAGEAGRPTRQSPHDHREDRHQQPEHQRLHTAEIGQRRHHEATADQRHERWFGAGRGRGELRLGRLRGPGRLRPAGWIRRAGWVRRWRRRNGCPSARQRERLHHLPDPDARADRQHGDKRRPPQEQRAEDDPGQQHADTDRLR